MISRKSAIVVSLKHVPERSRIASANAKPISRSPRRSIEDLTKQLDQRFEHEEKTCRLGRGFRRRLFGSLDLTENWTYARIDAAEQTQTK